MGPPWRPSVHPPPHLFVRGGPNPAIGGGHTTPCNGSGEGWYSPTPGAPKVGAVHAASTCYQSGSRPGSGTAPYPGRRTSGLGGPLRRSHYSPGSGERMEPRLSGPALASHSFILNDSTHGLLHGWGTARFIYPGSPPLHYTDCLRPQAGSPGKPPPRPIERSTLFHYEQGLPLHHFGRSGTGVRRPVPDFRYCHHPLHSWRAGRPSGLFHSSTEMPPGVAYRRPALVAPSILSGRDKRVRPLPACKFFPTAPPIRAQRHFTCLGNGALPGTVNAPQGLLTLRFRYTSRRNRACRLRGAARAVFPSRESLPASLPRRRPLCFIPPPTARRACAGTALRAYSAPLSVATKSHRPQLPADAGSFHRPRRQAFNPGMASLQSRPPSPCRYRRAGKLPGIAPNARGGYPSGLEPDTLPHWMPREVPGLRMESSTLEPSGTIHGSQISSRIRAESRVFHRKHPRVRLFALRNFAWHRSCDAPSHNVSPGWPLARENTLGRHIRPQGTGMRIRLPGPCSRPISAGPRDSLPGQHPARGPFVGASLAMRELCRSVRPAAKGSGGCRRPGREHRISWFFFPFRGSIQFIDPCSFTVHFQSQLLIDTLTSWPFPGHPLILFHRFQFTFQLPGS